MVTNDLLKGDKILKTSDFWFDLPEELIAQTPLQQRDSSRMLKLDRMTGEIQHKHFYDIIDYLQPGDCLVMNDSRVLPARLLGTDPPVAQWRYCFCVTLAIKSGNAFANPAARCRQVTK
jgi:S-adenosylmethionine:tRNA-ribosyltransferase-isomerase (queuine synthetase)